MKNEVIAINIEIATNIVVAICNPNKRYTILDGFFFKEYPVNIVAVKQHVTKKRTLTRFIKSSVPKLFRYWLSTTTIDSLFDVKTCANKNPIAKMISEYLICLVKRLFFKNSYCFYFKITNVAEL